MADIGSALSTNLVAPMHISGSGEHVQVDVDLSPILRQTIKTQLIFIFSEWRKLSHGIVSQAVHEGV
jgi:hypothetical protein